MRSWIILGLLLAGAACHSATAPSPVTIWNYQASQLSSANGEIVCTFGAAMVLSDTTGTFTGNYENAYLTCSSPNGASSTLVSGNINSGSVSGTAVSFQFENTDVTNSGEISATTGAFNNSGDITANTMQGTATVNVTLGGQPYVVTGPWQATLE